MALSGTVACGKMKRCSLFSEKQAELSASMSELGKGLNLSLVKLCKICKNPGQLFRIQWYKIYSGLLHYNPCSESRFWICSLYYYVFILQYTLPSAIYYMCLCTQNCSLDTFLHACEQLQPCKVMKCVELGLEAN